MAEIIIDLIPSGKSNRPGYPMVPQFITIHDTANTDAGADAAAHARYLKNTPGLIASWHFTVDDRVIYQHLPLDENGWHAGDGAEGTGNRQSIGIEICENKDGNRSGAESNAAWLTAKLLRDFSLARENVKQHYHWSGKNCPRVLRGRAGGWKGFLQSVEDFLKNYDPAPGPEPEHPGGTAIVGRPQATPGQAQAWAAQRGAHQRFMDIAPVCWHYGDLTGVRPEVLYAQSAKETAFGNYGDAVTPEQNNWAGIKVLNPQGDEQENHETFASPEDGVRGHFNHISAYTGLEPVGEPHERYWLVKSFPWAGTIRYVEELGGKWNPSADYGISIVKDYLEGLLSTVEPPAEPEKPVEQPAEPGEPSRFTQIILAIADFFRKIFNGLRSLFTGG